MTTIFILIRYTKKRSLKQGNEREIRKISIRKEDYKKWVSQKGEPESREGEKGKEW